MFYRRLMWIRTITREPPVRRCFSHPRDMPRGKLRPPNPLLRGSKALGPRAPQSLLIAKGLAFRCVV
ncbi:hypothetical protein ES705_33884 [subsurface metagenome]